jgi:hypothetical protein
MERIRGAAAETRLHGHAARSSWAWDGTQLEYGATVPVGFRATLVLPGKCGGAAVSGLVEKVKFTGLTQHSQVDPAD